MPSKRTSSKLSSRLSKSLKLSKKSCKALTLVISGLLVLCALYLLNKYVFKINENFQESQPEERQEEDIQPEEEIQEEEIQPPPPQPQGQGQGQGQSQEQNMSYILINRNSPNQELNCGLDPTDDSKYLCQITSLAPPPMPNPVSPPPPMPNTPPDSAYPTPPTM